MKFLQEFENVEAAEIVVTQLRQVGILSHFSVDGSSTKGGILPDRHFISLYTVLENQHEDAVAYLTNKNHSVTTGLSKQEIENIDKSLKDGASASLNNALAVGIIIVLGILIYILLQL